MKKNIYLIKQEEVMNIHILQHIPFEDTGAVENWIKENNHRKTYTKFYEDDTLPDLDSFDFLIILGGFMGAYE
jgi:GMP synthase-like glutamine amidotransferase